MSKNARFIHLRTHSEYSLLEGAIPLKSLIKTCVSAQIPAVAITDTNNMFCALEFSVSAQAAGLQPILGCQISLAYETPKLGEKPRPPAPIVLLVQSEQGYMNLMKLNSCLYIDRQRPLPHITLEELERHHQGLICLSGGASGPLGCLLQTKQPDAARLLAQKLTDIFGDRLYIELQRHPNTEGAIPKAEALSEAGMIDIAYTQDIPLVATNDAYFPAPEMYEAHDALLCIADGTYIDQEQPRRQLTPQHYLKSEGEMCALFADLPEATANTVEIAQRCAFFAHKRAPILPSYAENEVEELRRQAYEGLDARLANTTAPPVAPLQEYKDRLAVELDIIEKMGFPGYFLIVADFIKWAKLRQIPVGPGRGSGAGSLVAYALTITDLDPLRYGLLFERFLNPERLSMPDFDIDFCMDRREEVIRYVQERYGREKVGQIATFGALLSKAAIRDVGRVLQLPYGQVDKLSKMIPLEGVKPVSIAKARKDEPRLRNEAAKEEVVERLLGYAEKLEGLYRNVSTHAAGVVIADRPLDELVPLYQDPRSDMPATQFNMKWAEQAGLVKFDFLGLKTLTVIQNAVELLAARNITLDMTSIAIDDAKTYELYASARTIAVFQVESQGMMDALRRMKPTCIEDIVALVALYRPGPMENIPTYCEVKNGQRPIVSIHPSIDHILKETQGIIVYQEQVMQIAQIMAGYSLGEADLLRRAMGKKVADEMARERPKFILGAQKTHAIGAQKAGEVFDILEKFANYGFNKSHAAAYAMVSYQTAYLKANYPIEFMAAVMNCDIHLTDKLALYKQEVDHLGITMRPPCVNHSDTTFTTKENEIIYALGALKNVGAEVMELIVSARKKEKFTSIGDFARRVHVKRIGKRPMEMLIQAGAFDCLEPNRARLFDNLDTIIAYSNQSQQPTETDQISLFGTAETSSAVPPLTLPACANWLPSESLANEHVAIGFYLSGHPLDNYVGAFHKKKIHTFAEVLRLTTQKGAGTYKIAGTVSSRKERKSVKGNRFAFVQLSDTTNIYEVTVFSDLLEKSRHLLESGQNIILSIKAEPSGEDDVRLTANSVEAIDDVVRIDDVNQITIQVDQSFRPDQLQNILSQSSAPPAAGKRPNCTLNILGAGDKNIHISLKKHYIFNHEKKAQIQSLPGVLCIELD